MNYSSFKSLEDRGEEKATSENNESNGNEFVFNMENQIPPKSFHLTKKQAKTRPTFRQKREKSNGTMQTSKYKLGLRY